jgi:tRNA acetyltransferase TAN1
VISDFNLLATTSRGNERQMCSEMLYLLKEEIGDPASTAAKTGVRGLIAAKTTIDPCEVIGKFRAILQERPYEFRYALRIIPIEKVVRTDLDEIKRVATTVHSRDFIEAAATGIHRKANLESPDKILLIEVIGGLTGMSLIKPSDILAVVKEKML